MSDRPSVPESHIDLLTTNVLASIATVRPDGSPAIANAWVDFDGTYVLTSSVAGSRKGRNIRSNPAVAVAVVDPANTSRYLQIRGRVVDIRPDPDLAFIDKLTMRAKGRPHPVRDKERDIFVIEIVHVRAAGAPAQPDGVTTVRGHDHHDPSRVAGGPERE